MKYINTSLNPGIQLLLKSSLFTLSLFIMVNSACNGQDNFDAKVNSLVKGTVPIVKVDELKNMLHENKNILLLDTRSEEEYQVSKIDGAEFVDYEGFNKKMVKHIPQDQEIVVYCSVGYRSEKIGEKLKELGYTNVLNLHGGIFDWKNKDNEVVNAVGQETDSVHTYNKNWSKWLYKGVKVYE